MACDKVNEEQQPAMLGQALAAATAIPGDDARARALAGLAPHLPPDLLPQELKATPKTSIEPLTALLRGMAKVNA